MLEEDIGQKIIDKLENIGVAFEQKIQKLEQNERHSIRKGKKNSHIHLLLETNLKEKLVKEAEERNIGISELCRQKLRGNAQLDRIERKIDNIIN